MVKKIKIESLIKFIYISHKIKYKQNNFYSVCIENGMELMYNKGIRRE